LRKLVLIGLTVTAVFAIAAVAIAQYALPTMTVETAITPAKGGTKKKPKNALVHTVFRVNADSNSTLKRIEYAIPSKIKLDGTGFKTCSVQTIAAKGESACPKGSRVGTGAATALLGPQKSPLNFSVNVYAAGKKSLTLYLVTSLFTLPIPATITADNKVVFDIPDRVQQPVPGLYSYVTSVTADLGKQPGIKASVKTGKGKKRKTRYFASLRGCSGKKHTLGVTAFLADNPNPPKQPSISGTGTSACKK
jgi:hypothetical protein